MCCSWVEFMSSVHRWCSSSASLTGSHVSQDRGPGFVCVFYLPLPYSFEIESRENILRIKFFSVIVEIISYILWRIIRPNTADSIILWTSSWEAGTLGVQGTVVWDFPLPRVVQKTAALCHLMELCPEMERSNDNSSSSTSMKCSWDSDV